METTLQTAAEAAGADKDAAITLWNPTAAVLWSLLFSPALGAWLLMRNWQRLGLPDKAKGSAYWMIGVLAINVANLAAVTWGLAQGQETGLPWWSSLMLFCVWVALSAYPQIRHIDDHHGEGYARRSWGAPLLVALVATIAFMALAGTLGAAVS